MLPTGGAAVGVPRVSAVARAVACVIAEEAREEAAASREGKPVPAQIGFRV